jgi:peptidoglycan/LPS O-acetylase OafA/YrhL
MEEERAAAAGHPGAPGGRLGAIDGLRALAVLAVVAHHSGLLPLGYGTRGVDLFFVISGFCLALPTLRQIQAGGPFSFDRRRYARGRIARIVPPYYAALALFVLLSYTSFGLPSVLVAPGRFEWLKDALFATSMAPAYNASFWTLGIEARWYVVFPIFLSLYVRSKTLFGVALLASYLLYAWNNQLIDFGILPLFLLGIVAAHIYVAGKASSPLFAGLAFVSLVTAILTDPTAFHGHPIWHAASFFSVVAGVGMLRNVLAWKPLAALGIASYSIYLVHQPIVLWLLRYDLAKPVCALIAIGAGLGFWLVVEQPSLLWEARFKGRGSSAQAVAV